MVFRRDSKVDAFQRQISALRHQLGGEHDAFSLQEIDTSRALRRDSPVRVDLPELTPLATESGLSPRDYASVDLIGREPIVPAVPAADAQTSVIAHTTAWNGNLESSGSLHIHGRVEGIVAARDDVFIAEEAEVDAAISAANVTVAGNVRGSIQCADRFEILPGGRVAGDVHAPVVVIHEGALIAGEIAMTAVGEGKPSSALTRAARNRA